MKTKFLSVFALAVSMTFSAPEAFACGGVSEGARMCVALPTSVSTFLQNDEVREILRAKGTIRHLMSEKSRVDVAYSDSAKVTGTVKNGEVTRIKTKRYSWPINDGEFFVQIADYPAIVKLLIGTEVSSEIARIRAEKSTITSLYQMNDGSPLIRVNGTGANSYSIVGIMNADGSLEGIVIK